VVGDQHQHQPAGQPAGKPPRRRRKIPPEDGTAKRAAASFCICQRLSLSLSPSGSLLHFTQSYCTELQRNFFLPARPRSPSSAPAIFQGPSPVLLYTDCGRGAPNVEREGKALVRVCLPLPLPLGRPFLP